MIKAKLCKLTSQYTVSTTTYIVIATFLIAVFYNLPNILQKIAVNHNNTDYFHAILYAIAELFIVIATVAGFLGLFSFSRVLVKCFVIIFILFSSIFAYYVLVYNIFIDELFIDTIVKTNSAEVSAVVSFYFIIYVVIFVILPLIFFSYSLKITAYKSCWNLLKSYIKTSSLVLFCLLVVGILNYNLYVKELFLRHHAGYVQYVTKSALSFFMPLNYIAASSQYYYKLNTLKYNSVQDIANKYPFQFTNNKMKNSAMNIILVIGESARADHQYLNGYQRNTNPELAKINNLLSFSKVEACDTYSVASLNCLLSYKNKANFAMNLKESNLISAFNALGFDSYFISTQSIYNDLNYMYFAIKDAKTKILNNKIRSKVPTGDYLYDEYILNYTNAIKKVATKHKLIIIYLTGSHAPYFTRYPKKFQKFKPDTSSRRNRQVLINAYDNTILYSDYVLSKLIKQYQNQNTFLYYVADHGESLGEGGFFYHGAKYEIAPKQQKHVAQFIWASDSMIKLLDKKYEKIKLNKDKAISHDFVFHSLFNCFGIESKIIDKRLSICN